MYVKISQPSWVKNVDAISCHEFSLSYDLYVSVQVLKPLAGCDI